MTRLTTNNLLETSFLMDRSHKIVDVSLTKGVYGVEELSVTLEGEDIDLDHGSFLLHGGSDPNRLPKVFESLMNQLWYQREHS